MQAQSKGIRASFGDRIRQIPGVRHVIGSLIDMVAFEQNNIYLVIVNGFEPNCSVLDRVHVLAGRRLQAGDGPDKSCWHASWPQISERIVAIPFNSMARILRSSVFSRASAFTKTAPVFMLLDELQRQMDRAGEMTGFIVDVVDERPAAVAEIRRQIEALDPNVAATPCAQFVNSLMQMKVTRTMSWFTSAFAIVIRAIGVLNTTADVDLRKTRGDCVAAGDGWRKWRVIRLILSESLILSLDCRRAWRRAGLGDYRISRPLEENVGVGSGGYLALGDL